MLPYVPGKARRLHIGVQNARLRPSHCGFKSCSNPAYPDTPDDRDHWADECCGPLRCTGCNETDHTQCTPIPGAFNRRLINSIHRLECKEFCKSCHIRGQVIINCNCFKQRLPAIPREEFQTKKAKY